MVLVVGFVILVVLLVLFVCVMVSVFVLEGVVLVWLGLC